MIDASWHCEKYLSSSFLLFRNDLICEEKLTSSRVGEFAPEKTTLKKSISNFNVGVIISCFVHLTKFNIMSIVS
jgi:hypothetical protein